MSGGYSRASMFTLAENASLSGPSLGPQSDTHRVRVYLYCGPKSPNSVILSDTQQRSDVFLSVWPAKKLHGVTFLTFQSNPMNMWLNKTTEFIDTAVITHITKVLNQNLDRVSILSGLLDIKFLEGGSRGKSSLGSFRGKSWTISPPWEQSMSWQSDSVLIYILTLFYEKFTKIFWNDPLGDCEHNTQFHGNPAK